MEGICDEDEIPIGYVGRLQRYLLANGTKLSTGTPMNVDLCHRRKNKNWLNLRVMRNYARENFP